MYNNKIWENEAEMVKQLDQDNFEVFEISNDFIVVYDQQEGNEFIYDIKRKGDKIIFGKGVIVDL